MKRGDIYLVDLEPTAGHEQRGQDGKSRPRGGAHQPAAAGQTVHHRKRTEPITCRPWPK